LSGFLLLGNRFSGDIMMVSLESGQILALNLKPKIIYVSHSKFLLLEYVFACRRARLEVR
jgi:hypothetical protein